MKKVFLKFLSPMRLGLYSAVFLFMALVVNGIWGEKYRTLQRERILKGTLAMVIMLSVEEVSYQLDKLKIDEEQFTICLRELASGINGRECSEATLPRVAQKAPKVFFYDNSDVIGDDGKKVENLGTTNRLKQMQLIEDLRALNGALSFTRQRCGHEIGFAINRDNALEEVV